MFYLVGLVCNGGRRPQSAFRARQERDVEAVLRQLGIDPTADGGERIIEVWNKIDRFSAEEREKLHNIAARRPHEHPCLLVSAVTGEGIDELLAAIEDRLAAAHHA